jgi:GAF domain-containing protein
MREDEAIGALMVRRTEVRPFTDKQIELVTTFANQAVIAIENVRLFESVEARTRELAKSLEDLRTTRDRLAQTQKLDRLGPAREVAQIGAALRSRATSWRRPPAHFSPPL